jgi:hypothetical protein
MTKCRNCGCTISQAAAGALALGFEDEFAAGAYSCCQVAAWADEQWFAWSEAAVEDGKSEEQATKSIEVVASPALVSVVRLQFDRKSRMSERVPADAACPGGE